MRSLQALITFQIALQVCMGLQIIRGSYNGDELGIAYQKMRDDLTKGNYIHQKVWDDLSQNGKGQGGGHPPVLNLTSDVGTSCSCGKVLISSLGPAANFQPQAMGTYSM